METLARLTSGLSESLVYVAIALVTLVGFVKCIYPVLRNGTLLNRAVMKLEKSTASGERPIWREARFLGRALRQDWQRFLLNAGQLDLRGMPCDASEYINEDTVIYKPGHSQLAELLPSLLTSLGILGTFIGLMEGLTSLNFSNAAGTIESIPSLLSGMRYAFATSVAGISCSLVFNMLNRIMVGRAFKALDAFDEAFYELAMPRPLDTETQMLCQKQDDGANIQRATQLAVGQMAGTLEMAISRAMHPLTMSMDNFIQGTSHEQVEGVQHIVGQFVQQMNRSLGGQMGALSETMSMVNQSQQETQRNLKQTLEAAQGLAEEARRIQTASHSIADRMESDTASELAELLRQQLAQQTALAESLQASQASLAEGLHALTERVQQLEPGAAVGSEVSEELAQLTISLGRMRQAVDELSDRVFAEGDKPKRGKVKRFLGANEEG